MEYFEKKKSNYRNSILDSIKKEITFELDNNNSIIDISHNVINILGFSYDEMITESIFNFIDNQESCSKLNLELHNNIEMSFIHKNGNIIYMELQIKAIEDDNGKVLSKCGSMIDISKYKEIEHREQKLKIVLENAKDIIYRFEILPEPKFVYVSSAIEDVVGCSVQANYDDYMIVFNTAHPEDIPILNKKITNALDYSKPIEARYIHKNGSCIWLEDYITPEYDGNGNLVAIEGVCRDISERKALEDKLNYLTYHDSLTGLKNRTFYDKQIEKLNTLNNQAVGIIVCDLDKLKVINDTMGHNKGDSMIKSASDLLLGIENDNISISRVGGDEFVILIRNTSEFEIKELCENINLLIKKHNSNNPEYPIELSIGYAFAEKSVGIMEEVFKIADKNMYANKLYKYEKNKISIEVT